MNRIDVLLAARGAYADLSARLAAVLRSLPDLTAPLGGGSTWTVREAAVHLVVWTDVYGEIAAGVPSPVTDPSRDGLAASSERLIADVAETDPEKLAALLEESTRSFLRLTDCWPGDHDTSWHAGIHLDLADLTVVRVAETLLHGYDIATAAGAPWPVEPGPATLSLGTFAPLLPGIVNPQTAADHTATYGISLRGGPTMTLRFTNGSCALEPAGGPVDCEISADPAAFLLVFTGRVPRWPIISLGLVTAAGPRPELAPGLPDLFVFP